MFREPAKSRTRSPDVLQRRNAAELFEPFREPIAEAQALVATLKAKASLRRDLKAVREQAIHLAPRVVALRMEFEAAADATKLRSSRVSDVRRSLVRLREELDELLAGADSD